MFRQLQEQSGEAHLSGRTVTVRVWDKPVEITVYQKSKTVWIAYGEYMGHSFEVKSQSPTSAAKLWADAARYKTN